MRIARVVGNAVSTIKVDSLHGSKLLVVRAASPSDEPYGEPFVAVDAVGAGEGELVLISEGSAGRYTPHTADAPVDAVILAILDSLDVGGQMTFRKH
ncbi:ethanolamine utilization protein EutN [Tessaracoccus lapidicaptus]|uniref:Ethanolamine utilization protein EutN n=1 Tax=Tessaracoccus lapidicaptus TaxID=1427523 RepID=A0A1C0AKH6_9ACTN|nr:MULTISPECIES: EutN/CcmL family microcompartment protein [Tessaracoccus]AQX16868.1 ethanolamine utilization protein EutN [Tessaracoccus sp. T2.5-30]OCL33070.1 ethanolamine utilization protein EutN [Tessaracoccus lapidicaptus]VEP41658.1 Ethanolamine utilization protein EutN [Tessaracoccus lapidicaptus]